MSLPILPEGTRVRVVQDPEWDGPWQREFDGTVQYVPSPPEPVLHTSARPGELAYWVRFDEPQRDADGDGPYDKAHIWDRYLRPLAGHLPDERATGPA
ncbi:ferrous iron transport protein A [Kitasatospora sp. NPDC056184]|uniref:ferrous iron transport protein A n=1 Tax=Kitasatospora sp. NPDC056184 TaxID=3345738 RepID=UPI0035D54EAE